MSLGNQTGEQYSHSSNAKNRWLHRSASIEDLFIITSTLETTFNLKFRIPTFIIPDSLFENEHPCFDYTDTFYDDSTFSYAAQNHFIRERSINGVKTPVTHFTVDVTNSDSSCHIYKESPFPCEMPSNEIIQFSFKRYYLNPLMYVDEVYYPVAYKVVTVMASFSRKEEIQQGFCQILGTFRDVLGRVLSTDEEWRTNLNHFLIANQLFPVPTKFMYTMKCANIADYLHIYQSKDLPSRFIHDLSKYLVDDENIPQTFVIKEYLWDMFEYPQFFALHYKPSIHSDLDTNKHLNDNLRKWKKEFVEDPDSSMVYDDDW